MDGGETKANPLLHLHRATPNHHYPLGPGHGPYSISDGLPPDTDGLPPNSDGLPPDSGISNWNIWNASVNIQGANGQGELLRTDGSVSWTNQRFCADRENIHFEDVQFPRVSLFCFLFGRPGFFFCFVAFYFPFPRFLVQTRSSGTLQRTVLTNDCLPGNPPGAAMMSHAHSLRLFPVPGWGVFLRPIVPNRFFLRSTRVSSARIACLARAACAGVTVPWTETVGRVERESGESFFVPGRPV